MRKDSAPDISIVILCYKAGDLVPNFVARMKKVFEDKDLSYEIVLVANYNDYEIGRDKTPDVVSELARRDSTLKIVANPKEGMMGWDMKSGLKVASGNTIAVIDGDGQMPPEDVLRVYEFLVSGGFDMVKTYREERFDGSLRLVISRVYNIFLKILFPRVKVRDANSKPKIFTREALKKLRIRQDDWFIDPEIIIQATYLNFKIGEIPTKFYENKFRKSFIKFSTVAQFIKNLLIYRFRTLFP